MVTAALCRYSDYTGASLTYIPVLTGKGFAWEERLKHNMEGGNTMGNALDSYRLGIVETDAAIRIKEHSESVL